MQIIRHLVARGANLEVQNGNRQTAQMLAGANGHKELFDWLMVQRKLAQRAQARALRLQQEAEERALEEKRRKEAERIEKERIALIAFFDELDENSLEAFSSITERQHDYNGPRRRARGEERGRERRCGLWRQLGRKPRSNVS